MSGNGGLIGQPNIPNWTTASGMWRSGHVTALQAGLISGTVWPSPEKDASIASVTGLYHMQKFDSKNAHILDSSPAGNHLYYRQGPGGDSYLSTTNRKFFKTAFMPGASTALCGWLDIGSATGMGFGTGDFTAECWIYPTTISTVHAFLDFRSINSGPATGPLMVLNANGSVAFYNDGQTTRIVGSAGVVAINGWYHIAASRTSGSTMLFVDGTQQGSNYTDSNNYNQNCLTVGGLPTASGAAGNNFCGYMQEVRITKGVGRYTANFTAPTLPFPDY